MKYEEVRSEVTVLTIMFCVTLFLFIVLFGVCFIYACFLYCSLLLIVILSVLLMFWLLLSLFITCFVTVSCVGIVGKRLHSLCISKSSETFVYSGMFNGLHSNVSNWQRKYLFIFPKFFDYFATRHSPISRLRLRYGSINSPWGWRPLPLLTCMLAWVSVRLMSTHQRLLILLNVCHLYNP